MATSNNTIWTTNTTTNTITNADLTTMSIIDDTAWNTINNTNGMTIDGDLTIRKEGKLLVEVDGETVVVSEKISETDMILDIMTTLLDALIKDNPEITSAKSVEELIDQHKMMKKLST
jgi:hypothetical protein